MNKFVKLPSSPTNWNLVTWGSDGKTLADGWTVPTSFSPWGTATTWYVVTKTAGGYEWAAPSGWDVVVSTQANNILTTGMKIRCWEETDYSNLWTYDNNTLYLTIPDQS